MHVAMHATSSSMRNTVMQSSGVCLSAEWYMAHQAMHASSLRIRSTVVRSSGLYVVCSFEEGVWKGVQLQGCTAVFRSVSVDVQFQEGVWKGGQAHQPILQGAAGQVLQRQVPNL